MRVLTVRQPWAWAIIHGGKDVENRVRNIAGDYRGPVAIHAGLRPEAPGMPWGVAEKAGMNTDRVDGDALHLGHIIGVVDLVDVHDPTVPLFGLTGCQGECTPWSEMGQWHLVLANPRALDEPIPWKGALGLRKTDLELVGDYLAAPWGHPNRSCTPYGCEPGCELEPVARLVATS
jgi:hypothetical protein